MRVDPDRAFQMFREANPIPDPGEYRLLHEAERVSPPPDPAQRSTTMTTIDAPPAREQERKPRLTAPVPLLVAAVAVIALAAVVLSLPPERATVPFDNPVEAIRALVTTDVEALTDLAPLFTPRASVDTFGQTSTWDSTTRVHEFEFGSRLETSGVVESCRQEGDRGVCRVVVTDSLLEGAGLSGIPQEWSGTLGDAGRIATLRQRIIESPESQRADEWFIGFNQWICRNHPEEGRAALWDPHLRLERFDSPDCSAAEWRWMIGAGADPEAALALHEAYLQEQGS